MAIIFILYVILFCLFCLNNLFFTNIINTYLSNLQLYYCDCNFTNQVPINQPYHFVCGSGYLSCLFRKTLLSSYLHVYSHQLITLKSVLLDATTVLDLAMSAVELMNDDDFESVVVF